MNAPQSATARKKTAVKSDLDPRVARLKEKMLTAPYEICMARAKYFTRSYRQTAGRDPAIRNALALKLTLEQQKISIYEDEYLSGSKTEKYLAGPLSVERGDFLRTLQMEMDFLEKKRRPFFIEDEDKRIFREEVLPYWDGRTVRDRKAASWQKMGLVDTGLLRTPLRLPDDIRFVRSVKKRAEQLIGAAREQHLSFGSIRNLIALRNELAFNNPTPAVYCFDVQGHLTLGVDKAVKYGFNAIIEQAAERRLRLQKEEPENQRGAAFLEAVIISLKAAIDYAARFVALAEQLAAKTNDADEKARLLKIAHHLRRVPAEPPRTFHEALQAVWFTEAVGEIQYGTHDVFGQGRIDQILYPLYKQDIAQGQLTEDEAIALVQEYFIKLTANVEPIPELGQEANATLANSQHCVVIGGRGRDGADATNELSFLALTAYERMGGSANQLCVRISDDTPSSFLERTLEVFRTISGIAIYNDETIEKSLLADGFALEDARDYTITGCVETCGQADTHGCVGGHEIVLPAILSLAMTNGHEPAPAPGQQRGFKSGRPDSFDSYDKFISGFRRQLAHQIEVLVKATAAKDEAYQELLPAPYVSALMGDCIENATDIVSGGSRYNFTSIDVRGLATVVDSLLAVKEIVYDNREMSLPQLNRILHDNFAESSILRGRIINKLPKYGAGEEIADKLALDIIDWIFEEMCKYRNNRGGKYRGCYYSYGNHVIDGLFLGATPDGRLAGEPISNGVAPSNLVRRSGSALDAMKAVAQFPPEKISSGISLNIRFHPKFIENDRGLKAACSMVKTYFALGGMHLQPNIVSTETLRAAQEDPAAYRDLIVKVAGYSAYFTDLGRSIQDDIIARTEFQ